MLDEIDSAIPMDFIEYQILLSASDVQPGDDLKDELHGLMAQEFDQGRLIDMAVREGLAGLLYKNLKKAGVLGYLEHQHIQQLQSSYYLTVRFNLKLIYDLKEVLQQLDNKNIKVVLLQGIHLLQQIYKDIGLRPLTDIDLWVLPETRYAVDEVLSGLGFEKHRLYPNIFKKGSSVIDLNTHILWADRIKSRQMLINQDQEALFQNCRTIDFEGQMAYRLSRTDQIVYLSLHAIKHYADRLIWLVDLKNLLQNWQASDWELLVTRCNKLGQENAVYYIMFLLTQLFDCRALFDVPDSLDVKRMNRLERKILENRLNGRPLPVWSPMLLFTSGKGFYKKAAFIFESLFPRPEILRQVFAKSPNLKMWQLYLKRAVQLVGHVKS
jgi:hypothetical protein